MYNMYLQLVYMDEDMLSYNVILHITHMCNIVKRHTGAELCQALVMLKVLETLFDIMIRTCNPRNTFPVVTKDYLRVV